MGHSCFCSRNTYYGNNFFCIIFYGYGTNNEHSDIDLRGVLIEDKKYLFGLKSFEQFEDLTTDTVVYGLKKFIRLCAEANPNILELLGTDDDCVVLMNEKGKPIRDNANLFLTKKVINSFRNYAAAQLRRLQNALCHDSYENQEKTKYLCDVLNKQFEHFKRTYTYFENGSIYIYVDEKSNDLNVDINLKAYPIKDFVGIYSELKDTIKTYDKLNHRNNKKDDGRLYKHAMHLIMHLIRLLVTGADILKGKGIKRNYNKKNRRT